MFSEADFEQMVTEVLPSSGWRFIPAESLPRHHADVLVESMVREALIRLNPEIAAEPSRADEVIYKLRALLISANSENLVERNEDFKTLVFEKNSFPFGENGRAVPIKFFETDPAKLDQNEYVVTNQWVFPQMEGGKRLDIVLLVNGFPLVIGELKTPVRDAVSWMDGAQDILDYQKSIPQMFVTNVFTFASEGKAYRYSSVKAPLSVWGPWHEGEDRAEGTLEDVRRSMLSMLTPAVVLDIFRFFTIFATDKKFRKIKIICRYQQYEGANAIIKRVVAGFPKKGLIWHFQGSGKSLLMVFAALKLRMMPELKNPTVVIVDDRIDLETQITATFNASDIPNLAGAGSKEELVSFFKGDMRKILITTIFKFGEVTESLNLRDNIILMVDEAHRTQEGDLGEKMRLALPNAFFFGLTGTPINRLDKNTFRTFGAIEDRTGYMSRYTFADSVRDKATLPLHFEAAPVELQIDQESLNAGFDAMTEHLTSEDKSQLAKRVHMEAIIKADERVRQVCAHIAEHFKTKVDPNGFKGQVVCYDRDCCMRYKTELGKLLGEYATTIVMDTNNDKAGRYAAFRRDRDAEAKVLDDFRDPNHPLKLVIVTSKLLTGFDAPILQAMYLDKPMKDHTLLQAICRTNRVYGEDKTHGLIVDYVGIFNNVAKALRFDDESVQTIIKNIEEVKKKLPELMAKCLSWFPGVDRTQDGWGALLAAQQCIPTNHDKDAFGADYRVLNRAWNALSPDSCLHQFKLDYRWLSKVYQSVRPVDNTGKLIWASLGQKTLELVNQNVDAGPVGEGETVVVDASIIDDLIAGKGLTPPDPRRLEIDLVARLLKHKDDDRFVDLAKRLEELRQKHQQGLLSSMEFLKLLLELAHDVVKAEKETPPVSEEERGKAALTELFQNVRNENTPVVVERIVKDIDDIVRIVRFDEWQKTTVGCREVKRALRSVISVKYQIKDKEVFNKAYRYVEQYY